MDDKGRSSIKNLEDWAKRVTAGYRDVNVRNTTTSFRDGLAFCAIVHHYRPDLIDFDSLSKENIFENNSLAFSTAEKQLGVPALLEANDMVAFSVPDRLSIITYLSTLHNCLENQNRVKTLKSIKRAQNNSAGPPFKIPTIQSTLLSSSRNDTCNVCQHRVFILERLIIDNKLYHTTCFRCCKCNCLLNPGTYVESDTPGVYECAVCTPEENSYSVESQDTASLDSFDDKNGSLSDTLVKSLSPVSWDGRLKMSEAVSSSRSNFLQHSLSKSPDAGATSSSLRNGSFSTDSEKEMKDDSPDSGISVKDKITVFESNRNSKPDSPLTSNRLKPSQIISNGVSSDYKSPRTSSLNLSLNSTSDLSEADGSQTAEKLGDLSDLSPETVSSADFNNISSSSTKSTELQKTSTPQIDKLSCDSDNLAASESTPTPSVRRSLQPLFAKDGGLGKSTPTKFQIGDYKSPLKSSRDIFRTNIQPLKLSIPSVISSSSKTEVAGLTPLSPTESPKPGSISIPEIRSNYTRSLPRPKSGSGSLLSQSKPPNGENCSETNLGLVPARRSSLESFKAREEANGETDSGRLVGVELKSEEDHQENETDVLSESTDNLIESTDILKKSTDIPKESDILKEKTDIPKESDIPQVSTDIPKESDVLKESTNVLEESADIPVPTVRHSLIKANGHLDSFQEPSAEVDDKYVKSETISKPEILSPSSQKQPKVKTYPDDLNPFGDEDDDGEEEYPDDLNPFGEDEDYSSHPPVKTKVTVDDYDESKNPFASDDDDENMDAKITPSRPVSSPGASPFQQNSAFSSPTGSLRGTTKKRLAPRPPKMTDIFPPDLHDSEADTSFSSLKSSPTFSRHSLHTPSPKLRKSRPPPPPPPSTLSRPSSQGDLKQVKNDSNMVLKSSSTVDENETPKQARKKKRPAPPVPIPKRKDNKKIPLKEILREMKEIEEKQRECERQGREIELLIRDKDKDEEPSVEEEEFIMQLFDLVNQKNALFRRQAELMYIKRSQRLEEQQAEVQMKIRQLLEKPEAEKTDEDKAKEDDLILELKDIVDQRSSIIDSIEMDRRRELEEDASVQEQIEIKNGDLPITAEIKEKSGKKIKFKLKKDKDKSKDKEKSKEKKMDKKKKKKVEENGESTKGSAKKKWLSK